MRFYHLFFFFLTFMSFSNLAQAQFTSKSTTTSQEKSYGEGLNVQYAAPNQQIEQTQQTPQQPVFRARPQAAEASAPSTQSTSQSGISAQDQAALQAMIQASGEDEIPSFAVFEQPAQTGPQEPPPPPPPPPEGEVWFYVTDFETSDVNGKFRNCLWKVVAQNRTDTKIEKMTLDYHILAEKFSFSISGLAPQAAKVISHARYTDMCPAMRGVKPKISMKKCTFGPLKDEACLPYIVIK